MSEPEVPPRAARNPDSGVPVDAVIVDSAASDSGAIDMHDPDARARAITATLLPGFTGTELPEELRRRLESGLGGVCVFGPNIVSEEQLRQLNESIQAAGPLAVIAIDEEGGDVTRLNYADGSPYPGNAVLGRLDDEALTECVGRSVGFALRRTACTLDFAPDVDVNSNPDNPVIGVRSFGADASLVARHSAAWTRGIQSAGVAACAKHFPGHGDTALDSHLALPVIDRSLEELRERELVPFRAAIAAGTHTIMTSHIVLPQVDADRPATFSSRILQGILRQELAFDGVIVSDALDMKGASGETGIPEAAVRALEAGCDLLCIGTDTPDELIDEIVRAVDDAIDSGRLSIDRVADAARRVRALARELAEQRAGIPLPSGEARGQSPADDKANDERSASAGGPTDAPVTVERAQQAFDVRESALAALRRAGATAPFAVVRIETEANIAVGVAPWGPFARAAAEPDAADSQEWARHPQFVVSETDAAVAGATGTGGGDTADVTGGADGSAGADGSVDAIDARIGDILGAVAENQGVVVIGKALHRYGFARRTVDALRARRTTLAVDMGWPADDRAYADVATFGASRLIGSALIALLENSSADGSVAAEEQR